MPYADSMTLRLRAALLGSMVAGVLVPSCGGESTDTSASAPRIDGGLTTDATGEDFVVGPVVDSSVVDSAVEAASDAGALADVVAPIDASDTRLVLCGAIDTRFGVPVPLQNATATFSQTDVGQFTVAKAIDGTISDMLGWGVGPVGGGAAAAQTAAFETVTDTAAGSAGTRLVFVLDHRFPSEHALGKFRLSVTTSNRSTFADGNEGTTTPGNVGASGIWTVLQPRRQCATSGATMTIGGDSSILVQDLNSTDALYVVEADTTLVGITGVRLEVLEDGVLPQTGPGLQNSNGNFVLADFTVRAGTP